jgi:GNAT superfamily N-acetyltransferase
MEVDEMLALYDGEIRRNAAVPGMRREVDGCVVRLVMEAEALGLSFITHSDLDEENADEAIARQVAYFGGLKRSFEWQLFDYDRPADLGERLFAHGFEAGEIESILVLELARAPERLFAPPAADVRRLGDADLESVRGLLSAVWDEEFSWFVPRMSRLLATDGYLSVYMAYVEERPAAAAWVFFQPGSRFAGLYGGSTLPEFRGRGLYTALLAARAQEAKRRGYQFLAIDAGDMSRPIVERLGFRLLATATPYVFQND